MADNKNIGRANMYYYGNNPSQTTDEEQFKKILTITLLLPIFTFVILLLRLLCFGQKDREEQDAEGGNRERQLRRSSQAGGWDDRAPSSAAAGAAAVEMAPPVRASEPPLVCTYRKADGWREGSSCGVCLADLDDGDVLRVLPACMHYFHGACVGEWLRAHDTCPLCRAPLIVPPADATT